MQSLLPWHFAIVGIPAVLLIGPKRLLSWSGSLLISLSLVAVLAGYLCYKAVTFREHPKPRAPLPRRFSFVKRSNYVEMSNTLSIPAEDLDAPAIQQSFLISESLNQLFDMIITNFVDSWFTKISTNTLFQDSIRIELKHIAANLHRRLAAVDAPRFLVFKVLPLITDHYTRFVKLPNHSDSYSSEAKLKMARSFNGGKLHPGVSLAPLGAGSKTKEKAYLREEMQKVLPLLLSEKEKENELVLALLREILACTVLTNVFEVLSEDDFFNQMVVKFIGSSLQRRSQVRRLREALSEHTKHSIPDTSETGIQKPPSEQALSPKAHETAAATEIKSNTKLAKAAEFASLASILAEPHYAAIFREYLRGLKMESELDLWREIDSMKAPLEDTDPANISLHLEFSNKDDIIRIYKNYFANTSIPIRSRIRRQVQAFVNDSTRDPDSYRSARAALFELQADVFTHMETAFFPEFCSSSRFGDLAVARPKPTGRVVSTAFAKPRTSADIDVGDSSSISPGVVKAVESAFERIMESSPRQQSIEAWGPYGENRSKDRLPGVSDLSPRVVSQSSIPNSEPGSLNSTSNNRLSALFQNDSNDDLGSEKSDVSSIDSTPEASGSQLSNSEILLAAPGDLSLAEEIGVLNQDIENLTEQNEILTSLIKKAELTNNTSELKVLRRSIASLEREIYSKELQKQQYIVQENENSLFGKSKVRIQSCVYGKDENLPYVLYIIEVQKFSSEDPTEIVAGWVVARRFSQFHKLNEYLKRKCPEVSDIPFPKKSVPYLKFQKSQQIEVRKPILENYLQKLLDNPKVCSDPVFRSFLSSENFNVGKVKSQKKALDGILNKFYQDVTKTPSSTRVENAEVLQNIQEMERELKQFDDISVSGNIPFVKPISDLLLSVFKLGKSSWLRGRALLVILQQVLGSTLEKTITSVVNSNVQNEEKLLDILTILSGLLFPDGKFRETPELRTNSQRAATRQEASLMLKIFMSETCSKIFGSKNTNGASKNIAEMFQNDYLNKHLLLEVLDELLMAAFPELEAT